MDAVIRAPTPTARINVPVLRASVCLQMIVLAKVITRFIHTYVYNGYNDHTFMFLFTKLTFLKPFKLRCIYTNDNGYFFFSEHILIRTSLPIVFVKSMLVLCHSACCCHRTKRICDVFLPSLSWHSSASFPGHHCLHYCLL